MWDKKRKKAVVKLIILILLFVLVLRIFALTLSKFQSTANSSANVDVAFYVLKEDYQTMTTNLSKLFPQDTPYIYNFTIANTDGTHDAEVDIEYNIVLRATTNLPIEYNLYKNQSYDTSGATNIITSNEIVQDSDGTYFREMKTDNDTLNFSEIKTNGYQLAIYFPSKYNTINYQDIIESLEIIVNSKQIV